MKNTSFSHCNRVCKKNLTKTLSHRFSNIKRCFVLLNCVKSTNTCFWYSLCNVLFAHYSFFFPFTSDIIAEGYSTQQKLSQAQIQKVKNGRFFIEDIYNHCKSSQKIKAIFSNCIFRAALGFATIQYEYQIYSKCIFPIT